MQISKRGFEIPLNLIAMRKRLKLLKSYFTSILYFKGTGSVVSWGTLHVKMSILYFKETARVVSWGTLHVKISILYFKETASIVSWETLHVKISILYFKETASIVLWGTLHVKMSMPDFTILHFKALSDPAWLIYLIQHD